MRQPQLSFSSIYCSFGVFMSLLSGKVPFFKLKKKNEFCVLMDYVLYQSIVLDSYFIWVLPKWTVFYDFLFFRHVLQAYGPNFLLQRYQLLRTLCLMEKLLCLFLVCVGCSTLPLFFFCLPLAQKTTLMLICSDVKAGNY